MKQTALYLLALLALFLPVGQGAAQHFVSINLPAEGCAGSDVTVRFGYDPRYELVVNSQQSSLGHTETIFLPDGVPCNGECSYVSPVTFDAFYDTQTISQPNDIKFLRIKMEHSYIGDIYIRVTCPNGQKADIMRFAGTGVSSCDQSIPIESRHWLQGNNMGEENYFGVPKDKENEDYPCLASAMGNEPGTGWNYCWSNNTASGYQYASGDGIVYRDGHQHGGRVDSSDVAAHTNFYHPDESFGKLAGCPLNGTWQIEVVDGYSIDNGYIFEWELALDASLMAPLDCVPVLYAVLDGTSVQVNDTTFTLVAPTGLHHDTTIHYTFRMITSCGDTIDTAASIVYHPTGESSEEGEVCEGEPYVVAGQTVYGGGEHTVTVVAAFGCDSIIHLTLNEHPSYDLHFFDTVCINNYSHFDDSVYGASGVYEHRYRSQYGCDSVRTLHLSVTNQDLRARIYAVPLVVTSEHPVIYLRDASEHHQKRRWELDGMVSEEEAFELDYPVEQDSLPIMLVAFSDKGCSDTATATARIDRTMVSVPNAFTPILSTNSRWEPVVYDAVEREVWVYNRQGALVAHLEQLGDSWDGNDPDGRPCPQGTYVYTMHYRSRVRPELKMQMAGSVTLIR